MVSLSGLAYVLAYYV